MLTSVACQQWQLFCLQMLTHTLSTDILYLPNPLLIVLDKGGGVNPYGQPGGKIYVFLLTTSQNLRVDGVDDCVGWARNLVFIASAAGTEFLAVGSADFNYLQTQSSAHPRSYLLLLLLLTIPSPSPDRAFLQTHGGQTLLQE